MQLQYAMPGHSFDKPFEEYSAFGFDLFGVSPVKATAPEWKTVHGQLVSLALRDAVSQTMRAHYMLSRKTVATLLAMGCSRAFGVPSPACAQAADAWASQLQSSISLVLGRKKHVRTFLKDKPNIRHGAVNSLNGSLRVSYFRLSYSVCNPERSKPLRTVCLPSRSVPFFLNSTRCHDIYQISGDAQVSDSRFAQLHVMERFQLLSADPAVYGRHMLGEWRVEPSGTNSALGSLKPNVSRLSMAPPAYVGRWNVSSTKIPNVASCEFWCKESRNQSDLHMRVCPCRSCSFIGATLQLKSGAPCRILK